LTNTSKELLESMLQKMLEIRSFEEKVFDLYGQNLVPGTIHLYIGEEAVAVGVCSSLRKDDYITSTHRGHGHCIAKGADMKRVTGADTPIPFSPTPEQYVVPNEKAIIKAVKEVV
jgi:TPP-dependent pyruvate/acetoin dehydrogenase alpha subunit